MLKIKELRLRNRMTLDDLAAKSGVSKRMLSTYEANQSDITYTKMKQLAEALDVSILELTSEYVPPVVPNVVDIEVLIKGMEEKDETIKRQEELVNLYRKQNKLLEDQVKLLQGNSQLLEEKVMNLKNRVSELDDLQRSQDETLSA